MSQTASPYSDTRHMYKVHTTFRREFALLPALVRSVAAKDEERAQTVASHIRLVNLLLHEHHSGEDAVLWPLLLARAPREIDPVVHLVAGHHQAIEDLLTKTEVLEEKLVLPLAERHIFAAEYKSMVAGGSANIPPEAGPVLAGMLMYEGGLDVVPARMRAVLADLAPQAYAAHCERVHGTPTPPRSTEVGIGTPYVGVTACGPS
jgi:hypothetical protein